MADHRDRLSAGVQTVKFLPLFSYFTCGPSAVLATLPFPPEWSSSSVDLLHRPGYFLAVLLQTYTDRTTASSYKTPYTVWLGILFPYRRSGASSFPMTASPTFYLRPGPTLPTLCHHLLGQVLCLH